MKAGLNLFSVRGMIRTEEDFLSTAIKLREAGYSYLQYSGAAFDAERIKRVSERSGLPVLLTHVPMERILADTEKLMEEHALFGCKNIGLGMMPLKILTDENACKETIGALERAAEKMEENGFKFFYHHHHFEFSKFSDGETVFGYMLKQAKHINFTADTYWLQYGGAALPSFFDRLAGRMDCVHLKDYRIGRDKEDALKLRPEFAPVGDGLLDFKTLVEKMKALGAKYYFVEQDDAETYPDPLAQVGRSIGSIGREL